MSGFQDAAALAGGTLEAGLTDGYQQLSRDQDITFTFYKKVVLPLDGYVFWLRQASFQVQGSLHAAAARRQEEAEMLGIDRVWFTTNTDVAPFNEISPQRIAIGQFSAGEHPPFRFAFSQRGAFYKQSGLFHYMGDSINPVMEAQLVDTPQQIDDKTLIVSNSLPAWLAMQVYSPIWLAPPNPNVTLYPSFLVPDNEEPPYGTVHIEPAQTVAFGAVPLLGPRSTHTQLARDRVRVTLFGLTNDQAADWLDLAIQYIGDNDRSIGLLNIPAIRDEKRTQVEIMAIAMKKTIEFEVSYLQTRVNDIARQHITCLTAQIAPAPFV